MGTLELTDFDQALPDCLNLSVIMARRPSDHVWADYEYQALGVVGDDGEEKPIRQIYNDDEVTHFLVSGLSLSLHLDECESYYHNLMSPEPGCFVVAGEPDSDQDMPVPYLVSLSFDEAHAYLEGGEQVFSVAIPPVLYKWAEAYVLTHYVATKKTKRKLKNWYESKPS